MADAPLPAHVLADIEGLDAAKAGFERPDCCGSALPPDLPNSFAPLSTFVFLATEVPPAQWAKNSANIPGFTDLSDKMKGTPNTRVNAFHREGADPMTLVFTVDAALNMVKAQQFSGGQPGMSHLPWEAPGVMTVDRSEDRFVFVCAHRQKDERCGYCGPILVDSLRQQIAKVSSVGACEVYPVNHVGGHVYAGNVFVVSKHQAVMFGCVKPSDVATVVQFALTHKDASVPAELEGRVRGRMGVKP